MWGGTRIQTAYPGGPANFNPPSPCGEGPTTKACASSTTTNFNPPSPCGEGPKRVAFLLAWYAISIHPPRVGRDDAAGYDRAETTISIHPPRVGRDRFQIRAARETFPFQSTLPVWGGTGDPRKFDRYAGIFQSTLPVWGGTASWRGWPGSNGISIHPPRVGRD